MRTIPFYKDNKNIFHLGELLITPNQLSISIINTTTVNIKYANNTEIYLKNITGYIGDVTIAELFDSNGVAYNSLSTFLTAIKDLFSDATLINSIITYLTNGNQVTKLIDSLGNYINPAKTEDITALITAIQNSGGSNKHTYKFTLTRPIAGGTTSYSAGDVIATTASVLNVIADDIAKANGSGVTIYGCRVQTNDTGLAGKPIDLHLYEDVPDVTGLADNGQMVMADANATKRMGSIKVNFGSGIFSKVGMNDYTEVGGNLADKKLRCIITAGADFTPSAAGTWIQVSFNIEISTN